MTFKDVVSDYSTYIGKSFKIIKCSDALSIGDFILEDCNSSMGILKFIDEDNKPLELVATMDYSFELLK